MCLRGGQCTGLFVSLWPIVNGSIVTGTVGTVAPTEPQLHAGLVESSGRAWGEGREELGKEWCVVKEGERGHRLVMTHPSQLKVAVQSYTQQQATCRGHILHSIPSGPVR